MPSRSRLDPGWRAPGRVGRAASLGSSLLLSAVLGAHVTRASEALAEAQPPAPAARAAVQRAALCPPEMVRVRDFCVDRWEVMTVDRGSGQPLSPYYPPHRGRLLAVHRAWLLERWLAPDPAARRMPLPDLSEWQKTHDFVAQAAARPFVTPQGYLSYHLAKQVCSLAGKRLCTRDEWITACQGERQTRFPYGDQYVAGRCNIHRALHPAATLHGEASVGHRDPRLHLVEELGSRPLLAPTQSFAGCASAWGSDRIYDMVGNLDEWVEADHGLFLGGFYARSTTKGCEAKVGSHGQAYYDYSTGTRCCRSLAR